MPRSRAKVLAILGLFTIATNVAGAPAPADAATPEDEMAVERANYLQIEASANEVRELQLILLDTTKANFAGAWVDSDGTAHVAMAHGDDGIRELAKQALTGRTIFHDFRLTLDELLAVKDATSREARESGWELVGSAVSTIAADVVTNRVIIELVRPSQGQLTSVSTRFEDVADVVVVNEPAVPTACYEYNCPSPMKAGLRGFDSSGAIRGMTSFVFRRTDGSGYLISTAGHAVTLNLSMYHPAGTYRGKVLYDIDSGASIDAALWSISAAQAGNKLFDTDGYGSVGSITSRETEAGSVIGEPLCKSGRDTWWECGTLQNKNSDLSWVSDQYKANLYGRGGDSGSPIFYGTKAHGIAVGNDCNGCPALYYTPVKRVEEFWSNEFVVLTYNP
jgi:hypothetical protein